MYTTDLFDITITPASRNGQPFKISFVESTPYKSQVLKAIDMTISEIRKRKEKAVKEEDEVAEGHADDELQHAVQAEEIVKVSSLEDYAVEQTAVIVAGTQIGVIKIEQREVWKIY